MPVAPLFVKYSKLTLDAEDFQCEATSIGITSSGGEEQELTTLCPEGSFKETAARSYSLTVTLAQDVENLDSFLMWALIHDGETVDFTYYPKTDNRGNPVGYGFKGRVTVSPPDTIGGVESGNFATSTVTFGMQGKYAVVDAQGSVVTVLDPLNVTKVNLPNAATFVNLAALSGDATVGDGLYSGPAFTRGQYVVLGDGSKASYSANAWSAGAMP